jgi:hypothetical protein
MKKIIVTALLACAIVSTVFADSSPTAYQKIRIAFNADYSTVAMDAVNKQLNGGSSVTTLGGGIAGIADFDAVLAPVLMAGLRGGYLSCMTGSATYLLGVQKQTINASLIPIEAALIANLEITGVPISVMAGAGAGYGFAAASDKYEALSQTATFAYTGGGFVGELLAAVNYKLSSTLSLNINAAYRLAKITQMTLSQDVNVLNIPVGKKGDIWKDSDNKDLPFDFSGINIGVGFSMGI